MTAAKTPTAATAQAGGKSNSQITTLESTEAIEAPAAETHQVVADNHDENLTGDMEIVTIHGSGEDGGSDAVLIIHNGFARQIPRDKPCRIPAEVAQALRDCVTTSYTSGPKGAVVERNTPRYAMSSVAA